MKALRKLTNSRLTALCSSHIRAYHTYPEPGEIPTVTTFLSNSVKVSKFGDAFKVNEILRSHSLDNASITINNPLALELIPKNSSLSNGITVVSQDTSGMMTSISFTIGSGR